MARVVIVSRIFTPEPSAASFFLSSLAESFRDAGHDTTVVTVKPPRGMPASDPPGIRVRRARVARDRSGYVRGYLQYLSFDVPLAFRLLFSRRADLYVVEPPPTTGAVVRVIAALRRTPYVYRAADLWSDAAQMATGSRVVLGMLRWVETFALRGARRAYTASPGLGARMRELDVHTPTTPVGSGVSDPAFRYVEPAVDRGSFVYAGTFSEWHGAGVFVEALALLIADGVAARVSFVGNGSERTQLEELARERGIADHVDFRESVPPAELAEIFARSTASLASLEPGQGYDYAFTTKVYASLACGCPVLFAGVGPTVPFLDDASREVRAGGAYRYDPAVVAAAMRGMIDAGVDPDERRRVSAWTLERHSMRAITDGVVRSCIDEIGSA